MDYQRDLSKLEEHLSKLPADVRQQVEEMNNIANDPVEGNLTWLKVSCLAGRVPACPRDCSQRPFP